MNTTTRESSQDRRVRLNQNKWNGEQNMLYSDPAWDKLDWDNLPCQPRKFSHLMMFEELNVTQPIMKQWKAIYTDFELQRRFYNDKFLLHSRKWGQSIGGLLNHINKQNEICSLTNKQLGIIADNDEKVAIQQGFDLKTCTGKEYYFPASEAPAREYSENSSGFQKQLTEVMFHQKRIAAHEMESKGLQSILYNFAQNYDERRLEVGRRNPKRRGLVLHTIKLLLKYNKIQQSDLEYPKYIDTLNTIHDFIDKDLSVENLKFI